MLGWRKDFLKRRNLDRPTGDNLYTYKMSTEEFEELERELKSWLDEQLQFFSLGDIVDRRRAFNGIFVLYAAEWWKRRFSGGRWSWDPILKDLDLNPDEWSAPKRSKCIERGFRSWDIKLQNTHGLRFLGSVALQGGLPMKFLAENDKSIAHVLERTVNLIKGSSSTIDDSLIISWISSLKNYLPKTYQKEEIYRLLAQTVSTVLAFQKATDKDSPEAVIEEWKEHQEKWQSRLPILVGEGNTKQLLEKLVWDIASRPTQESQADIHLVRTLAIDDHINQAEMRAEITFPQFIEDGELRSFFEISEDYQLDRNMIVTIECETETKDIPIRKIAGQDKFKLAKKGGVFQEEEAFGSFTLVLRTKSGNKWYGLIDDSDKLQEDLPWIFVNQEEKQASYQLSNQGSCKVAESSAIIAIPENWKYESSGNQCALNYDLSGRQLYKVSGQVNITSAGQEDFRISTGQATDLKKSIKLYGKRVWDVFKNNEYVFRGRPKVRRFSKDNYQDSVLPKWKWSKKEKDTFKNIYGPVQILLKDGIYTNWRRKIVVLPEESSEEILYGRDTKSGQWKFTNWHLAELISTDPSVDITKQSKDVYKFTYNGDGRPPEKIVVNAIWPNNPNKGKLELDFPAMGARVFDADGKELPRNSQKTLDEIYGIRLFGALGNADIAQIYLKLIDEKKNASKLFDINIGQQRGYVEVRLSDFKSEIESLFAVSDDIDAMVTVRLKIEGYPPAEILIARYSFSFQKESPELLSIPTEELEKLNTNTFKETNILAQRMDVPGAGTINLPITDGGHVYLPRDKMSAGPWVIYNDQDSKLSFRPKLLKVEGNNEVEDGIGKCVQIEDNKERIKSLEEYLEKMIREEEHQEWNTLSQIVNEYSHLPLSFFDVWKCLVNNTKAMAYFTYLTVNNSSTSDEFLKRFSVEMPFMWEFITLGDWTWTLRKAYGDVSEELDDDLINEYLNSVILKISAVDDTLDSILRIAHLNINGPLDESLIRSESLLINELFRDKTSSYQKLLRKHTGTGERWPASNEMYKVIQNIKTPENSKMFHFENDYRDTVINTPIALAIDTLTSNEGRKIEKSSFINDLKTIKEFDPDWFITAYRTTTIRCLHNDLIKIDS